MSGPIPIPAQAINNSEKGGDIVFKSLNSSGLNTSLVASPRPQKLPSLQAKKFLVSDHHAVAAKKNVCNHSIDLIEEEF